MKKLIKSPYKPFTQILNRLSELEHENVMEIKKIKSVEKCITNSPSAIVFKGKSYSSVSTFTVNQNYLSSNRPDNIILLKNNKVIIIDQLLTTKTSTQKLPKLSEIYILGRQMLNVGNLFDYPTPSTDFGIFVGENFSELHEIHSAELMKNKCVLFDCGDKICAVSLLHE